MCIRDSYGTFIQLIGLYRINILFVDEVYYLLQPVVSLHHGPVSYTHLDVYKRQRQYKLADDTEVTIQFYTEREAAVDFNSYVNQVKSDSYLVCLEAVSYTHLDVYKRQHLDSRTMAYFQQHPIYNKYKDSIASIYKLNRPHYLKRIDTIALGKMTQLYCNDQLEKNPLPNESFTVSEKRYKPQIAETCLLYTSRCV